MQETMTRREPATAGVSLRRHWAIAPPSSLPKYGPTGRSPGPAPRRHTREFVPSDCLIGQTHSPLISTWEPAHGEFDLAARQFAPALDGAHIGRFWIAIEEVAGPI